MKNKIKNMDLIFGLIIFIGVFCIFLINTYERNKVHELPDLSARAENLENYLKDNKNDTESLLKLGLTYNQLNENNKAKEVYLNIIKIDPKNTFAWIRLGNLNIEMYHFEEAIEAYTKSIELDKNNSAPYTYLAEVLLLTDIDKAKELMNKSLEVAKSTNSDALQFVTQFNSLVNQLNSKNTLNENCKVYINILQKDFISSHEIELSLINNLLQQEKNIDDIYINELVKIKKEIEKNINR